VIRITSKLFDTFGIFNATLLPISFQLSKQQNLPKIRYGIATIKMQGMTERRSTRWLNLEIDTINTGIKVTKLELLFGGLNKPAIRWSSYGWG